MCIRDSKKDSYEDDYDEPEVQKPRFLPRATSNNKVVPMRRGMEVSLIKPTCLLYTSQGEPIVGMNPFAGQAYLNICRRVLGQEVPLMDLEKSRGIFSRFQGFLKRA